MVCWKLIQKFQIGGKVMLGLSHYLQLCTIKFRVHTENNSPAITREQEPLLN